MLRQYICDGDCETYFDNLFNSLDAGFLLSEIICDESSNPVNFKILELNKSFENMFKTDKKALAGKTILEVYPDIDIKWIDICGTVANKGKSVQTDIHFEFAEKHFRVNFISPTEGQFIALFTDITEIIKADEILKKHFLLFENAQDILLYLKADGSIIDANKTAVQKYGYSQQELLNMKLQDLRHPSTMGDYEAQMEISIEKGIVFECIHVRKDGSSFPVEVSSRSIGINDEIIRIHIIRDISERKASEKRIEYLANYDSLTGIPNRGFLMQQFKSILKQAGEESQKFAVFLFDVDKFKTVNDVHGHNAGDEVLKNVAERLRAAVRKTDIIGRLGGDEFLVIQPFIKNKDESAALAERILSHVAIPLKWNGIELQIHISIGISVYPGDSTTPEDLIHCADGAMYFIKQNGGNSYHFHSSDTL